MSAWPQQAQTHALIEAPDCFLVQLGRFPHRGKSHAPVRLQQPVRVPVYCGGIACEWHQYDAIAGILHFGQSPMSGHYRSILRVAQNWLITDDAVAATPCEISTEHRRGLYVVWLRILRKSAGIEPVRHAL